MQAIVEKGFWSYLNNSCHVDTWFMSELAAYLRRPNRLKTDGVTAKEVMLVQLLLSVEEPNMNELRDAFYRSRHDLTYNRREDLVVHVQWLCAPSSGATTRSKARSPAEAALDTDRVVSFRKTTTCSNGCDAIETRQRQPMLIVASGYYSKPDHKATMNAYANVEDAVRRSIMQRDATTRPCWGKCGGHSEGMKDLSAINLPSLLIVVSSNMPIFGERITIDVANYELVSVVFKTPGHYLCNAKLVEPGTGNCKWYTYNDLDRGSVTICNNFKVLGPAKARALYFVRIDSRTDNIVDLCKAAGDLYGDNPQYYSQLEAEEIED
jgi:hypothetical protein